MHLVRRVGEAMRVPCPKCTVGTELCDLCKGRPVHAEWITSAAYNLVKTLHDEIRSDIPDKKILGLSLRPPAWSERRIMKIAELVVYAILAGIAVYHDFSLKSAARAEAT